MMTKTDPKVWAPAIPKVIDLSLGPFVTEHGVEKSAFEAFFSDTKSSRYCGYKWELVDNKAVIYDMVEMPHEKAGRAFDSVVVEEALQGGWRKTLRLGGSGRLNNPDLNDSNWEPDCSYFPGLRKGPMGSNDEATTIQPWF